MKQQQHFLTALYFVGGIALSSFGIRSFLVPSGFIDGGATGIAMLGAELSHTPLSFWLVAVNAPFVWLGYRKLGRAFAVRSIIAIVGHAVAVSLIPFPVATDDRLLAAAFGGVFVGAGVGLTMRGGGVLDGSEILAVLLSKKSPASVGEVILAMNACLFALAAGFLGVEAAMYSALAYFAGSKTIDFLLHGIEAYTGVLIFSEKHDNIRKTILEQLGRGVTIFHGTGGYTADDRIILFCVVTRLEITRLEQLIHAEDDNAFLVELPVHEVSGGTIKRRGFQS